MAATAYSPKRLDNILPRGALFGDWIAEACPGDSIIDQKVTVANTAGGIADLIVSDVQLSSSDPTIVAFEISGGTVDATYTLTVEITTANSYIKSYDFTQKVIA